MEEHNIPLQVYKEILQRVPVPTIDIMLFTPDLQEVLLLKRTNKPAKGTYFSPGGRLFKRESFEACAKRKLIEEVGIEKLEYPLIQAGIINEMWEDSIFEGVPSHTPNVYFASILHKNTKITMDCQNSEWKWFRIDCKTLHPYIKEKIANSLKAMKKFLLGKN